MKKRIAYISSICFGLLLTCGSVIAQPDSEIKLQLQNNRFIVNGDLVAANVIVNATQSGDGIRLTVSVKNNADKAITVSNIAEQLYINLYNESGNNIALVDRGRKINVGPYWKFRSKAVVPETFSINGIQDSRVLRDLQYIDIPAGGEAKVNVSIKQVMPVDASGRAIDSEPPVNLKPGKYKLKFSLSISSTNVNDPGRILAVFDSPKMDIDYNK